MAEHHRKLHEAAEKGHQEHVHAGRHADKHAKHAEKLEKLAKKLQELKESH